MKVFNEEGNRESAEEMIAGLLLPYLPCWLCCRSSYVKMLCSDMAWTRSSKKKVYPHDLQNTEGYGFQWISLGS